MLRSKGYTKGGQGCRQPIELQIALEMMGYEPFTGELYPAIPILKDRPTAQFLKCDNKTDRLLEPAYAIFPMFLIQK